jgi:hypothetical protein
MPPCLPGTGLADQPGHYLASLFTVALFCVQAYVASSFLFGAGGEESYGK